MVAKPKNLVFRIHIIGNNNPFTKSLFQLMVNALSIKVSLPRRLKHNKLTFLHSFLLCFVFFRDFLMVQSVRVTHRSSYSRTYLWSLTLTLAPRGDRSFKAVGPRLWNETATLLVITEHYRCI